jgi:4-hydroxy-tetrahydrodipicolinate synthase
MVALPTAFDGTVGLDTGSVKATCELAAASLADGAFVGGTTGEFLALERNERRELLKVAQSGLGDKRLIAHIGAPSVRQAIAVANDAAEIGVREFALLTPLYLPASGDATVRFYEEVAAALPSDSRLYAYLFRVRTTTEVTVETLRRIADIAPLVGVKVSGETLARCQEYKAAVWPEFEIFTGSDAEYALVAGAGLTGVVSGIASCFPEAFDGLNRALAAEDAGMVREADALVQDVVRAVAGDIARIKTVLALRGIGAPVTRQAMDPVSEEVRAQLARLLDRVAGGPR